MSTKIKRFGKPRARDGELKVQYGKLKDDLPDIIFSRGSGVPKSDASLLYGVLCMKRLFLLDADGRNERRHDFGTSLLEELEHRGYDITTLRFSIQKKIKPPQSGEPNGTA